MATEAQAASPSQRATERFSRERLLSPWPQVGLRGILTTVILVGVLIWGLNGTNANPFELVAGVPNIIDFIVRLFPPDFDVVPTTIPIWGIFQPAFGETIALNIPRSLPYIVETLQMGLIGTVLGIVLSIPFGLLAARNVTPHPIVYQVTRMILNINRAIPELIFALIFVAAVGLGPFGGVLALAVGSIGSLAKLYAESIEQIDPQQAARSTVRLAQMAPQ
ncbi:hypothetical protein HC891_20850, partial [Candidatus Gracilibacteria bacterium]|nr:hypothetical protein [Candidatus Gracilibacteria bacterium]